MSDEIQAYIGPGSYFQTTCYDTHLIITGDEWDPFHYFELFDRKILWINPSIQEVGGVEELMMPRTVFICPSDNDYDGGLVMNRFASLICFVTRGVNISASTHVGTGWPAAAAAQPQQLKTGMKYGHDTIDSLIASFLKPGVTEKRWIALAHFRQGKIAQTPYYRFLSNWKILELHFNDKDPKITKHLTSYFTTNTAKVSSLQLGSKSPADKMWDLRKMSAHFMLRGGAIQDPDNPDLYNQADASANILEDVVVDLISHGNW